MALDPVCNLHNCTQHHVPSHWPVCLTHRLITEHQHTAAVAMATLQQQRLSLTIAHGLISALTWLQIHLLWGWAKVSKLPYQSKHPQHSSQLCTLICCLSQCMMGCKHRPHTGATTDSDTCRHNCTQSVIWLPNFLPGPLTRVTSIELGRLLHMG